MVTGYEILQKLTTRNYLAVLTATSFVAAVLWGILHPTDVADAIANPLITLLLGQFTVVVVLIYNFYFRKPQQKETTA